MKIGTKTDAIQQHNERPAAVWSGGGKEYDQISRGIADAIDHCVLRLNPQPGERILDLSTGTGWASRVVARRGANVIGVDNASALDHALLEFPRTTLGIPGVQVQAAGSCALRNAIPELPERDGMRIRKVIWLDDFGTRSLGT